MDNLLNNKSKLIVYFALFSIVSILGITPRFGQAATTKPVGYWSFDDDVSERVDDSSGNNNFGTISGGVTQQAGSACVEEECLEFSGSDGKITIPDNAALNFGDKSFSISVWVKTKLTNTTPVWIINKATTTPPIEYTLRFPGGADVGKIGIALRGSTATTVLTDVLERPINDGKWHHITIVIDRTTAKKVSGYIDGSGQKWKNAGKLDLPITDPFGSVDNAANLLVGALGGADYFPGSIDELKFFGSALTEGEVRTLYQEGATGVGVSCSSDADCTDKPGGHKSLECRKGAGGKRCVPNPANRKIGTWCNAAEHCNTQEGILKLTCNTEKNFCVVASSGISCDEDEVNTEPLFGKVNQEIEPFDRCDRNSLFCNSKFVCQADLGATSAEEIAGIGRGTEDIRDTIRNIINIALGFLGVIGVLLVMYGGWTWMTAMGEEEKVEKAKKTIIAGVIGMAIIGVAWTIVSFVLSATQSAGGG